MIVHDGERLAAGGIALGCAGPISATRVLQSLLFEAGATEPIVFAGVAALLAIVAATASWIPGHVARNVDPLDAVRNTGVRRFVSVRHVNIPVREFPKSAVDEPVAKTVQNGEPTSHARSWYPSGIYVGDVYPCFESEHSREATAGRHLTARR
jgi:hypothetical protein